MHISHLNDPQRTLHIWWTQSTVTSGEINDLRARPWTTGWTPFVLLDEKRNGSLWHTARMNEAAVLAHKQIHTNSKRACNWGMRKLHQISGNQSEIGYRNSKRRSQGQRTNAGNGHRTTIFRMRHHLSHTPELVVLPLHGRVCCSLISLLQLAHNVAVDDEKQYRRRPHILQRSPSAKLVEIREE